MSLRLCMGQAALVNRCASRQ